MESSPPPSTTTDPITIPSTSSSSSRPSSLSSSSRVRSSDVTPPTSSSTEAMATATATTSTTTTSTESVPHTFSHHGLSPPVTPSPSQASFDETDERSRIRLAGAVRRGGWRKVTSVATSRDHSDHSGDEHARPGSRASSSRKGKLVQRASTESVRVGRDVTVRRPSTKSLADDDADEDDEDGMGEETWRTAAIIGEASTSSSSIARSSVLVAPGAITQLPAMDAPPNSSSDSKALSTSAPAATAQEIDWANFVYAYARGKWNPMKPPKPPGRSTVFPGAKTRILTSSSTDTGDEASSEAGSYASRRTGSEAGGGDRRPSLGYEDLNPSQQAAAAAAAAGPSSSEASTAARRLSFSPLTALSSPGAPSSSLPSFGAVISRHTDEAPPPVALDPALFREGDRAGPSLRYEGAETVKTPTATAGSGASEADAALMRFATASSPELHAHIDDLKQKEGERDAAAAAQAAKAIRATHSTSEAVPGVTKARVRGSDGVQGIEDVPSVWAAGTAAAAAAASPPSPPVVARTKSAFESSSVDDGANQRPGPTPVQTSVGFDEAGSRVVPTTWQSAPEGGLATAKGLASVELVEQEGLLMSQTDEITTVAGMRRAARRSSVLREDDISSSSSKPIGIHSNSWSSEPGASTTAAVAATSAYQSLNSYQLPSLVDKPVQTTSHVVSPTRAASAEMAKITEQLPSPPPLAPTARPASPTAPIAPIAPVYGPLVCSVPPRPFPKRTATASSSTYISAGRQAEQFYFEQGYLPAINPPDELDRRRALARYGPPRISGDPNFDRIGHLVRLVFNSRIVLVSLVGASEQIFQTAVGGGADLSQSVLQQIAGAKHCSFCAHSILQASDEPLVILDTEKDWRFMGNPLVVGEPHIRFYAGCPLRTPDGHNLGSLCIIDSEPRTEFSPRLRHTLKEFGRVVMRELELTRDRIHLTIRDRMQRSIELFTRDCLEMATESSHEEDESGNRGSLHALYNEAAKNMQETLKASGAIVFDLSHFELIESPGNDGQSSKDSKIFYPSPFSAPDVTPYASFDDPSNIQTINSSSGVPDDSIKSKDVAPMAILGASESLSPAGDRGKPVPLSHHIKVAQFLRNHRTGSFYPAVPSVFRHLLPEGTSNMLLVPIFGLNRQPFALLCAYVQQAIEEPLEDVKDSALQYMRSMGTIILSAVLKKDLMLADQAKSHFISNISHELRTPLHGILASAELLAETKLNTTQGSYLDTVEACGKSLLELVNHVLDFTKLSGGARSKGNATHTLTQCDLVKLVQEVCESSWIGQTAKKLESQQSAGIGSAYASGAGGASGDTADGDAPAAVPNAKRIRAGAVETVIDVSMRAKGWLVTCDAGGIRRVLMNLIGNSLKFTTAGFVHVSLREVQSTPTHVVVELSVTDTGRGISKEFLEEQLFHPFTQENQLGPGTGLGLSIVNSIVQSPSINGKIDVWSTLGEGTEMRITCEMAVAEPEDIDGAVYQPALNLQRKRTVSLVGFNESRGQVDLRQVLLSYLDSWWNFAPTKGDANAGDDYSGDIIIVNEETRFLQEVRKRRKPLPPVILLSSALGDSAVAEACEAYHAKGGIARMLFKPAGPAKLEAVVDFCLQCLDRIDRGEPLEEDQTAPGTPLPSPRPSPLFQKDMEDGDSYFAVGRGDEAGDASAGDDTASGPDGEGDTPRVPLPAPRPPLSTRLRDSHHISPGPIDQTSTSALVRRHSTEDEIAKRRGVTGGRDKHSKTPLSSVMGADGNGGQVPQPHGLASSASRRPLLPPRSITFHQEPSIRKNVALSPSLLRNETSAASGGDYFAVKHDEREELDGTPRCDGEGEAEGVITPAAPLRSKPSPARPMSPGQTVRIDGSEDLLLRSALGTVAAASPAKASSSSAKATPPPTSSKARRRIRVLGVDDNEINIKVLRAFMDKFDVDFTPAYNGQECVERFDAARSSGSPFDIIILDVTMPVLDGYQATATIRRKEGEVGGGEDGPSSPHRVKILCLTGRNSEEDKRRAFASGADGFMTRPLSLRVLSNLMRLLTRDTHEGAPGGTAA